MTAVLTILKIAGTVILWLLAVLLIIILLFLICPIFYEAEGQKYENLGASAKVRLLFIFTIGMDYEPDEMDLYIKILGIKLKLGGKKKKPKEIKEEIKEPEKTPYEAEQTQHKPEAMPMEKSAQAAEISGSPIHEKVEPYVEEWEFQEAEDIQPEIRKITMPEKKDGDIVSGSNKPEVKRIKLSEEAEEEPVENPEKKKTEENVSKEERLDLNYFLKMPMPEKKELFGAFLKLIKSLLKGVLPKNFYLEGKVGLSDPSMTGQIVGVGWTLAGLLNKKIQLEAVFDREVLEGKFGIKGRIVPSFMLFYIIRFIAARPVRKIIKLFIKGDKNGK